MEANAAPRLNARMEYIMMENPVLSIPVSLPLAHMLLLLA